MKGIYVMSMDGFVIASGSRYRREPFGGILYNSVRGYTIEVNKTTQTFLELLGAGMKVDGAMMELSGHFKMSEADIKRDFKPVIDNLVQFGILVEPRSEQQDQRVDRDAVSRALDMSFPRQLVKNSLNAPEVIHLAITGKCPLKCPACYVDAGVALDSELSTHDIVRFIDIMDDNSVFQLGLGGGEALVHPDIVEITSHATRKGITVAITTSGVNLTTEMAIALKQAGIKQIQISHDGFSKEIFEQTRSPGSFNIAKQAINTLKKNAIDFGFNVLVTPSVLRELPQLVKYAEEIGAVELILLRPKPSGRHGQETWFETNKLTAAHQAWLTNFLGTLHTTLRIRTDTSFCMLYHFLDAKDLYAAGVFGCTAARRFCSIAADGSMFPCSHFFQFPEYNGGSCLNLMENWQKSPAFDSFRSIDDNIDEPCRSCTNMNVCKGCRKVAVHETGSFTGIDPYCHKIVVAKQQGCKIPICHGGDGSSA